MIKRFVELQPYEGGVRVRDDGLPVADKEK